MVKGITRQLALAVLTVSFVGAGFAQVKPAPPGAQDKDAGKGQPYEVQFALEEAVYTGTMTLVFAGTTVSGTMTIEQPIPVTGEVAGTLKEGALVLDYPFAAGGEQPCNGRVTVQAKMSPDGASATGTTQVAGCSDVPMEGTFSMKKKVSKGK